MRTALGLLCLLCLLAVGQLNWAAAPKLDSVYPSGGKQGSTVDLTLSGTFDPWPCDVVFSEKGFSFAPDPEKKGTGKLTIAPDAPLGVVLVRAKNADGVSSPRFFVVGKTVQQLDREEDKNHVLAGAEIDMAKLPLSLHGTLAANHEIDSFRLSLEKGETIHGALEGYTLRSLIDPVLHVYDDEGNRLHLFHDSPAHLDPRLSFVAPAAGTYFIGVTAFAHPPAASVYFRGDKNANYILHLASSRDQLPVRLFPAKLGPDTKGETATPGQPVIGTVEPGRPNTFKVAAKKGERWLVRVESRSLGYPLDPVLRIRKPDGGELRLVDDSNKEADAEYLWSVSADGDYSIEVGDRFRDGGPDYRYRLSLVEPEPDFTATLDKSEYLLEREKELEIKVKITRLHGHKADLAISIPGLPKGWTVTPPESIPEKGGDVTIKIAATKDSPAYQKPLVVQVSEKAEGEEKLGKPKAAVFSFRDDNYRGPYAVMEISDIWLTLPPVPKPKPGKEEKPKDE